MRVNFDTQREAKSVKKSIETLDIRITDGVGVQPYELYSGEEQFQVNFALRIAGFFADFGATGGGAVADVGD